MMAIVSLKILHHILCSNLHFSINLEIPLHQDPLHGIISDFILLIVKLIMLIEFNYAK